MKEQRFCRRGHYRSLAARIKGGRCRECHRGAARKRLYGMTDAALLVLFKAAGSACAICRRPLRLSMLAGSGLLAHIDHEHTTGKMRGFLCLKCNQGIGRFEDDPERLRAAAVYVERGRE